MTLYRAYLLSSVSTRPSKVVFFLPVLEILSATVLFLLLKKIELHQVVVEMVLKAGQGKPPLEIPEFFRHPSLNSLVIQSLILGTLNKCCP